MDRGAVKRPTRRNRRVVAASIVMALVAGACSGDGGAGPSTTGPGTTGPGTTGPSSTAGPRPGGGPTDRPGGDGVPAEFLSVRLSEGTSQAPPAAPVAVVTGEPLADDLVAAVLARLPEWAERPELVEPFAFPPQTSPPPRTGATVDVPFPPSTDVESPDVPSGPLEVLRFQPEGDVAIAPYLSITFDQPMVELATLDQLDVTDVPVRLTPDVPGTWQWIGTRTLRFDHVPPAGAPDVDRLPMATEYTVEIPAGTTSLTGGVLAEAVTWTFRTPPVQVQSLQPVHDSLPLVPVWVASFDQVVDPAAVLDTIVVRAGDDEVAVRLATQAEIDADEAAGPLTSAAVDGRWIAFRPVDPLPTDTRIEIEIGPGTPSAEGPRTTTEVFDERGRTYPPLEVRRVECGWGDDCVPGSTIVVELTNPVDESLFDPSWVSVEPAIAGLTAFAYGNVIEIGGATQARTTYTVTVDGALTDVFGQTLGQAASDDVEFGEARPTLVSFPRMLTTLDPLVDVPGLGLRTVNHDAVRVRVFDVAPEQWTEFQRWYYEELGRERPKDPPQWPVLVDREVDLGGEEDRLTETLLDLTDAFAADADGHVVVFVELVDPVSVNSDEWWANRPTATWVQSTTLGVDAFADQRRLVAWTTDLRTGAPIGGVDISFVTRDTGAVVATTDADGVATADLPPQPQDYLDAASAVIARVGEESVILTADQWGGTWSRWDRRDEVRWYVVDDRQIYRPGETVSVKGWVRRFTAASDGQLALLGQDVTATWTASDGQGQQLATGSVPVSPLGGFDLTFDLPAEANLGYSYLQIDLSGVAGVDNPSWSHSYRIEEFRRPEFEVVARPESQGPYVSTRPATVAAEADYYAGGPLPGASVDWQVSTSSASYVPPGREDFTFGEWVPWWIDWHGREGGYAGDVAYDCCWPSQPTEVESFTGTTDASGIHYLQLDFAGVDGDLPDLPVTVSAQATIEDVNRQAWASTTNLLVHPAELYVGLRGTRTFVRQGEPLDVEVIVTDIDGAAAAGRSVDVVAARMEWQYVDGEWTEVPVDPQTCTVTSAAEPSTCSFTTEVGGRYRITTTVVDDDGGRNRTELSRWVAGGDALPTRDVERQEATLVPDREEYAAGDTAEVLVQVPFAAGEGLAIVTRNGIEDTVRFTVTDGSAVLPIVVEERDVPGLDVLVEVVGATARTADDGTPLDGAPPRPAFAVGTVRLAVPATARSLTVDVAPGATTLEPGGETSIDLVVTGADGAAVDGAELAVAVVDEAVLALSGGRGWTDPLSVFHAAPWTSLSDRYIRETISLVDPDTAQSGGGDDTASTDAPADGEAPTEAPAATVPASPDADRSAGEESADGGGAAGQPGGPAPIDVRTDFDALALFVPSVTTGPDGRATVDLDLPDNLTRYRVMVLAVDGADRFGAGSANVTARLPLMVRPSAPRFANFGDTFELPVVVQNQTDAPMEVDVVVETGNLTLTGPVGQRVAVPANDRIEVRFPMAVDQVGTAAVRVAAAQVDGAAADAASLEFPVYTPATTEAFATYGVIDDGAVAQPYLAPTDVVPQFGGLEITTSSTSLQALTDAVLYLATYPYDSSDARASRVLAIVALRDVLDAFDVEGLPTPAQLERSMETDIEQLVALQNDDGGFPFWTLYRRSEPYNSVQVTHALVAARDAGYDVPQSTIDRALGYLADIEQRYPSEWGQELRDTVSAYALHVRAVAGDRDATKAEALWDRRGEELQLDAVAWLWPVVDDAGIEADIERLVENRAVDTAGAVTFTTSYTDDAWVILASDRRTDAVVLDALIAERPDSDLIPKVVAGLMAGRDRGRWENVQENSFVLLALHRYFEVYESQTPDFVARVWLGEQFAGEATFEGRSTDRLEIDVPMSVLVESGDGDLVLAKDGTGRLYYRLGLRYAPADLDLDPLDRGFVVERTYEAVDDPADVVREQDRTWRIRPGALVRVRVTMVAESQRTHVALSDPVPAGLEILNTALAVTPDVRPDTGDDGGDLAPWSWWGWTWYDHENARDDRAEAFSSYLPAGTYEYTYLARATTPGSFVVPPTKAEEMYAPETFGRGSSDRVVVG